LTYDLFTKHFRNTHIPIKPPKNTPLKLSYLWKNIEKLTNKFKEWNFTIGECDKYIEIMSSYVINQHKSGKICNRIVLSNMMLEYCYNAISEQKSNEDDLIRTIVSSHDFIRSIGVSDIAAHMASRHKPGALPNIVLYYQQGLINVQYIAFSQECKKALSMILSRSSSDRSFIPSDATLQYIANYQLRSRSTQIRSIINNK